ncbi:unnamed protein product, partial [Mesorhabditis belari]|uniref:G-protein coupled receptors family 1 profile domain-containing protein n=1 Tax=Mesorhabditis belari TaxID=2138241 RepID=A0AAF3F2A8_9BILA
MPLSDGVSTTSIIFYNIELFVLLVANFSCVLFLIVLTKAKCFHINLRILLANFAFTFLLIVITRYLIVIPLWVAFVFDLDIADKNYCRFAKSLHAIAVYVTGLGLAVLVIERTLATILVRVYETVKSRAVAVVLVLFQWSFGTIFILANQIEPKEQQYKRLACRVEYTSPRAHFVSLITIIVMDAVAMTVFLLLLRINRKHYQMRNQQPKHPKLSERYQTAENVRSTRLLFPLVLVYLIVSLLSGGILLFGILSVDKFSRDLLAFQLKYGPLFQSFNLIIATYAAVFPYLAMQGHQSFFNAFKEIVFGKRDTPRNPRELVPLSLDGQQLVPPSNQETEIHFANLKAMWK